LSPDISIVYINIREKRGVIKNKNIQTQIAAALDNRFRTMTNKTTINQSVNSDKSPVIEERNM
jgi:hypothetical protein